MARALKISRKNRKHPEDHEKETEEKAGGPIKKKGGIGSTNREEAGQGKEVVLVDS